MAGAEIGAAIFSEAAFCAFSSVLAGVTVAAGLAGAEFKGAPTAISHRCPGWPWAGFIPGAVLVAGAATVGWMETGVAVGVVFTEVVVLAGAEFNGAPTAISQRWPGWPWAGLSPAPVTLPAGTAVLITGAFTWPILGRAAALSGAVIGVETAAGDALLAKLLSNATLVSALESELLQELTMNPATMIKNVIFFICFDFPYELLRAVKLININVLCY